MTHRFDRDADAFVEGPPDDEPSDWPVDNDETLLFLADGQSNGRWLFVDRPDGDGEIPVGITRVYEKRLTPAAARALAEALLQAADESDAGKPERDARKAARIANMPVVTTASYSATTTFAWVGAR